MSLPDGTAPGAPQRDEARARDAERRYSSREFELIVRKAFELEERAPQTITGREGLTLDDMRSIAAEVGLEPAAIASAAALLPAEHAGGAARLLGAPEAWAWELRLDTALNDDARDVLLQTVRRVLRQRGEVRRVGDTLEWKSVGRSDHIWITITSRGGHSIVDITGDRRPALLFSLLTPFLLWGALAAAAGLTVSFAGASLVLPAGALIGAWFTARLAWRGASQRLRARLERLAVALRTDAVRLAVGPGDGGP